MYVKLVQMNKKVFLRFFSAAYRDRRRETGSGNRRVGSVAWDDQSAYYRENSETKGDGERNRKVNDEGFGDEHQTDTSSRSLTPDSKLNATAAETKESPAKDETFETKKIASTIQESTHSKGDGDYNAESQSRSDRPRQSSQSKRGNQRTDGGSDYYGNKGYYSQSRSRGRASSSTQNAYGKRYYGTGYEKHDHSSTTGGKYSQQNDIDEFDPNQLKDAGFASEFSGSANYESKSSSRGRGSRRGGGIPPRFSNRGNNSRHYDSYYSGGGYGHDRQSSRNTYNHHASTNTVGAHSASSAKSPTGQRDNQSEGNDEWETASESSDVGERRRRKPEKKDDRYAAFWPFKSILDFNL